MTTLRNTSAALAAAIGLFAPGCGYPGQTTDADGKAAINWSKVDGAGYDRPAPVGKGNDEMLRENNRSSQVHEGLKSAKDTSGTEPKTKAEPGKQDGGPR